MPERFPDIEPYDAGMHDVGAGQLVYWEVSGNYFSHAAWLEDGQLLTALNRFARSGRA